MKPIYDTWNLNYKSIFGAIKRAETCNFSVRLPKNISLDFPPVLVLFRTGFKERFLNMELTEETDEYNQYTTSYIPRYT